MNSSGTMYHECYKNLSGENDMFGFKDDLDILREGLRITMCQFRTTNQPLPIETGRWNNADLKDSKCPFCDNHQLGDECHYLFECQHIKNVQTKFTKAFFLHYPNTYKAGVLMNFKNKTLW